MIICQCFLGRNMKCEPKLDISPEHWQAWYFQIMQIFKVDLHVAGSKIHNLPNVYIQLSIFCIFSLFFLLSFLLLVCVFIAINRFDNHKAIQNRWIKIRHHQTFGSPYLGSKQFDNHILCWANTEIKNLCQTY